ncbi:hypothetical protein K3495_g3860 [Podosphaera aphanis]|nr:hypothetical protein K3495_g3860 [Podosphaera aphanis]
METETEIPSDQEIEFCTLGSFIIDEIHYPPPKPPVSDIFGGAGSYAALGARLFSAPPLSKRISWIVDVGSDFPPSLIPLIRNWKTSVILRVNSSRLTTRGWNGYDSAQNRVFKYMTPKIRLEVADLEQNPRLLLSKSFHLICSPSRCISLVSKLLHARKKLSPFTPKPLIIWEPAPDFCIPSELLNLTNCLPYVDICSPNHHELLKLLGDSRSISSDPGPNEPFDPVAIEAACEQLLAAMPLQTFALVVRCGAHGAYVAKNGGRSRRPSRRPSPSGRLRQKRPANHARGGLTPDTDMEALFAGFDAEFDRGPFLIDPGTSLWLPAYFNPDDKDSDKNATKAIEEKIEKYYIETPKIKNIVYEAPTPVEATTPTKSPTYDSLIMEAEDPTQSRSPIVDPTGAGNSFLGALSIALARGKSLEEAVCWGNIAASFVVEQVGVPVLAESDGCSTESLDRPTETAIMGDEEERWNGQSVWQRLDSYLERVRSPATHD